MTSLSRPLAKATNYEEQSEAIVVSFGSEWHQHVLARDFSLVIRKRVPTQPTFQWMYMHLNTPIKAMCARAPISCISRLTSQAAIDRADDIRMSQSAIQSYIGSADSIGAYQLGSFQVIAEPLTTAVINRHLIYHPPQSFFILSRLGKAKLDALAGFAERVHGPIQGARNT